MIAAALLLAAAVAAPQDRDYRAALDLLYDGRAPEAQARLTVLERTHPDDPVPAYLQALALAWIVEQRPETTDRDRELEQATDRAWAQADARVRTDPADARALFARGAASGVRSRHHLFRLQRAEAARAAAQMREDLLAARALDPDDADVLFGLGLYDYYVDVLPRFARVLRFLTRLPGGDRARGLRAIETASRTSTLHAVEARVQLYEIHAFYEDAPDEAADDMEQMWRHYPGWPLWGLKLAEHLRDRLGDYAESEAVARRILQGGAAITDPGPGARALARLSLGESLLLDLEPEEARHALRPLLEEGADVAASPMTARARVLLGRALELEGDRAAAVAQYRLASDGPDRESRRRAQAALDHALPPSEREGWSRLAAARRARAASHAETAAEQARAALAAWPGSREAALGVAEDDLRAGRREAARVPEVADARDGEPAWLVPWSRLLRARKADLEGQREVAVELYKKVYAEPRHREDLRAAAAAGLHAPFRGETGVSVPAGRGPGGAPGARTAPNRLLSHLRPFQQPCAQAKPSPVSGMPPGC